MGSREQLGAASLAAGHWACRWLWEQCRGDLGFNSGFYLTDCSCHPSLPLFNCFFFLPSHLSFFFLPPPSLKPHPTSSTHSLRLGSRLLTPPDPQTPPPVPPTASLLSSLQNSGTKDCDVHYAELDTAALASSPSPRTSIHAGGDLVEYATIQPNLR